jgi:hypothetical protein
MTKKSLDAMMQAVQEGRAVGQRALMLQARVLRTQVRSLLALLVQKYKY